MASYEQEPRWTWARAIKLGVATTRCKVTTMNRDGVSPRSTGGPRLIQSVERALQVLDLFACTPSDLSVSEISGQLELDQAVVSHLLATLEAYEYAARDAATGRYRLGLRALDLAATCQRTHPLVAQVGQFLSMLAVSTEEVANLFVSDGDGLVRLACVHGRPQIVVVLTVRVGLHCTAAGKVLLAAMPDAEIAAYAARTGLPARTPRTLTTLEAVLADSEQVRQRGYAIEDEENVLGRGCIAAPIRDAYHQVIAAVSISLSATRLASTERQMLCDTVREIANAASAALGYGMTLVPGPAVRKRNAGGGVSKPSARGRRGRSAHSAAGTLDKRL